MTNQQKARALKAHLREVAGFIPSNQWLKDNIEHYEFIDGKVYHRLHLSESQLSHNHDISEPDEIKEVEGDSYCSDEPKNEISSEQSDHSSEHTEAYHKGVQTFLDKYSDVQLIKAHHFRATNRFLILCKDLNERKREWYCLFWWDLESRISTGTGDYVDCLHKYQELLGLIGECDVDTDFVESIPKPDLSEYYRDVVYCPADGKRCEQLALTLEV